MPMNVALYARVSTEVQEARGTIGSQLEALRTRAAQDGHHVVAEFLDDGYSGTRLDRPGLDALRDGAEAGQFDLVLCLTPDRLARAYGYQFLVLEEFARLGVRIMFIDAPPLDDDPQSRLLIQMQGVIAEYERAKILERHRRGTLFRARAGEIVHWKVSYGYRRVPRGPERVAHLVIFEPEAVVVRRIFADYTAGGDSIRAIIRRLYREGVPSPTGLPLWRPATLWRLLRNSVYAGRALFNHMEALPPSGRSQHSTRHRLRPRDEWITIPVPAIITEEVFEAAQLVSRDNSAFSPRNTTAECWLLRRLVRCGRCDLSTECRQMRDRHGIARRYYRCQNHDQYRAGSEQRRCQERSIRADQLDAFVFGQVREALLRPDVLLAGERAVTSRTPTPDDELLTAQLQSLDRKLEHSEAERRRLLDVFQTGLVELAEFQRRVGDLDLRRRQLTIQKETLVSQRRELAQNNRLRQRVGAFAERIRDGLDELTFQQRQRLLRLVVEQVRVQGWQVEIRLRIPLDDPSDGDPVPRPKRPRPRPSTDMRLRSVGVDELATIVGVQPQERKGQSASDLG
jgi:site-specific DNA recombinase